MAILEINNLRKSYRTGFFLKRQLVIEDLSLKVEPGKITGFLGGNGAGKTTTIKCALGLAFADSGEIKFFDNKPFNESTKRKIGFLPERPYFYEYLTGIEFLMFYGRLSSKLTRAQLMERIERLLKRVDLWHARDRKLRGYSKGMLQKVGLAQALVHDPEFIILDEPMSGLDPDGRFYIAEIIRDMAKEGKAVFFSSHLLHDVERLCENLVILKDGKNIYNGSTEEFLQKMGASIMISYFRSGEKSVAEVSSDTELQAKLSELIKAQATIVEVRRKRGLEEAFVEVGLRGHSK